MVRDRETSSVVKLCVKADPEINKSQSTCLIDEEM